MNQDELLKRINARLNSITVKPLCFLCGKPSSGTVIADGEARRTCADCSTLIAESRYWNGEDVAVKVSDYGYLLFSHEN